MDKLSQDFRMGIHNRFDVEVIDICTKKVKKRARGYNVVCDKYWEAVLNGTVAETVVVGSGSGTPSSSDTWLFNYVGVATNDATLYGSYDNLNVSREVEGIWYRQLKRTIPNTAFVGTTLTEIGLAINNTSGNLLTHAMLQDMNGNPISIEHTATDVINIYCTIYLHYAGQNSDAHIYHGYNPSKGYGNYSSEEARGLLEVVLLKNKKASSSSYYGSTFFGPISRFYCVTPTNDSYMPNFFKTNIVSQSPIRDTANRKLTLKSAQVPVSSFNARGIRALTLLSGKATDAGYGYKGTVTPVCLVECGKTKIPPSRITSESIGVGDGTTTKFKTAFDHPYNATIYINGNPLNNGVTVNKTIARSLPFASDQNDGYNAYDLFRYVYNENILIPKPYAETQDYVVDYGTWYLYPNATMEVLIPDIGIQGLYGSTLKASNDGENWVDINTSGRNLSETESHYKYYKKIGGSKANFWFNSFDGYNIIFDTPPASGDVITIDYTTDHLAKDTDHVLDIEFSFTFGEWTGE